MCMGHMCIAAFADYWSPFLNPQIRVGNKAATENGLVDNERCNSTGSNEGESCEFSRNLSCIFHICNAIYTLYRGRRNIGIVSRVWQEYFAIVVRMYVA